MLFGQTVRVYGRPASLGGGWDAARNERETLSQLQHCRRVLSVDRGGHGRGSLAADDCFIIIILNRFSAFASSHRSSRFEFLFVLKVAKKEGEDEIPFVDIKNLAPARQSRPSACRLSRGSVKWSREIEGNFNWLPLIKISHTHLHHDHIPCLSWGGSQHRAVVILVHPSVPPVSITSERWTQNQIIRFWYLPRSDRTAFVAVCRIRPFGWPQENVIWGPGSLKWWSVYVVVFFFVRMA